MQTTQLSNEQLLEIVLGARTAAKVYKGRLTPLMVGERGTRPHKKLSASLELARRLTKEQLIRGPALVTSKHARDYFVLHFAGQQHESFVTVLLDIHYKVLHVEELFRGTLHHNAIYPREVAKLALRFNAAACIFAHNHPSGSAVPSPEDIDVTKQLKAALELLHVDTVDHVIVGAEEVTSMAERRML